MADIKVSFSVVTYNDELVIKKLLDSIFENTNVDFRVYVIDNNSSDKTVEIIKSTGYDITLIENEDNDGFGKAHNKVLPLIDSEYHVFINPDIEFHDSVIDRIAVYLDMQPDIGIVMPKVLSSDATVQILPKKDPRFLYLLSRRLRFKWLVKYREEYEMLEKSADEVFDIEFASGCFMFVRTDLIKELKGFDERYFLYFEDADFSRRIREHARVQYNPEFMVYHQWDRAGAKSFKCFTIQVVSMLKYFCKWKHRKTQNEKF